MIYLFDAFSGSKEGEAQVLTRLNPDRQGLYSFSGGIKIQYLGEKKKGQMLSITLPDGIDCFRENTSLREKLIEWRFYMDEDVVGELVNRGQKVCQLVWPADSFPVEIVFKNMLKSETGEEIKRVLLTTQPDASILD